MVKSFLRPLVMFDVLIAVCDDEEGWYGGRGGGFGESRVPRRRGF